MSHFRVLWPDQDGHLDDDSDVATAVIPFTAPRRQRTAMNAISRAQALFANRVCPFCSYAVVEPLELHDAAINSAGLPIPGTSTLVGFHCHGCDAEWGV